MIIEKELRCSYEFFNKEINLDENSKGYGLIKDKTKYADDVASIASVGYGFGAIIIGIEHGWMTYEEGLKRVDGTLNTFINNVEHVNGFYYHFVNMETGKREWKSEVSIIDTGIFICGALTVGEYFGGEVKEKAKKIYDRINWQWYLNKETNQFYMGYLPESGFYGSWDMYGEQLMLYILAVSSETFPVHKSIYQDFEKAKTKYNENEIIYTYCGTLFTYQFTHAWIDFRGRLDRDGIDWFENSVKATKAHKEYCLENVDKFKTYGENSWGLTSCIGPKGYSEYGAKPCRVDLEYQNDGTVAPCGAIGSIVFLPDDVIETMKYFEKIPELWGEYGFKDGYNFEKQEKWFADEYIGIDKGIEILMIENYLSGAIWKYSMKNEIILKGLKILEINKVEINNKEKEMIMNR